MTKPTSSEKRSFRTASVERGSSRGNAGRRSLRMERSGVRRFFAEEGALGEESVERRSSRRKGASRDAALNHLPTGGPEAAKREHTSAHEVIASSAHLGSDHLPTTGIDQNKSEAWTFSGTPFRVGMLLKGRYRLERELGRGGMGVVYLAIDQQTDTPCAIKALYPNFPKEALEEEFALAQRLEHPSIVRVERFEQEPSSGLFFLVMEYVEGQSLDAYFEQAMAKGAPFFLDTETMRDFLVALTDALEFAHEKGVIHRDLKPANLLLAADGTLRVLDFSIAKRLEAQTVYMTTQRGTPVYMAPEQLVGNARLTPAVDTYAVGAILYHGLTGILPYGRLRPPSEVLRAEHKELPFDHRLDQALLRALEHDPAARYESVEALCDALLDALDAWSERPPRRRRRRTSTTRFLVEEPTEVEAILQRLPPRAPDRAQVAAERTQRAFEKKQHALEKKRLRAERLAKKQHDKAEYSQIYRSLSSPKMTFWWGVSSWGVMAALFLTWLLYNGIFLGWVHEADIWSWWWLTGLGGGLIAGIGRDDRPSTGALWMSWMGVLYLGGFLFGGALGLLFLQSMLGEGSVPTLEGVFRLHPGAVWWAAGSGALGTLFVWWVVVPCARLGLKDGLQGIVQAVWMGIWRATLFALGGMVILEIMGNLLWQRTFVVRYALPLAALVVCVVALGAILGLLSLVWTVWTDRAGVWGYLLGLMLVGLGLFGMAQREIPTPPTPYQISAEVYHASQTALKEQHRQIWNLWQSLHTQHTPPDPNRVYPVDLP